MSKTFIKCKYAGDMNDEYCSKCDGLHLDADTDEVNADDCNGYEPSAEAPKVPAVRSSKPTTTTSKPAASVAKPAKTTPPVEAKQEETPKPAENPPRSPREEAETAVPVSNTAPTSAGITTTIKATSSVTIEVKIHGNSRWYKCEYSEERAVSPTVNIGSEKENLWSEVNNEVDRQIEDIELSLSSPEK